MRSLSLALLLLASTSDAQVADLLPGSRVRVESSAFSSRVEGTFLSREGEALVIARSGALRMTVPISSVNRVRVSQGKSHGSGAIKGIKIGAIVGGIVTLGLVATAGATAPTEVSVSGGDFVAIGAVMATSGAFYGAIIGGVVGAEKWTTVYDAQHRPIATR